jgi:phosphate transport system ATP-binding protein
MSCCRWLRLGELMEYGETKQIFEDPQNEKTREYVRGQYG